MERAVTLPVRLLHQATGCILQRATWPAGAEERDLRRLQEGYGEIQVEEEVHRVLDFVAPPGRDRQAGAGLRADIARPERATPRCRPVKCRPGRSIL
jgi:hypothetical protein